MSTMRLWLLSLAIVALTSPLAIAGAESDAHPQRLEASIGGFLGSSYHLKWDGRALIYTQFEPGRRNPKRFRITPSSEQWSQFRNALDDLQIWTWRREHVNPDVRDGTQWSLDVAYKDRELRSRGDNAYPDAKGQPSKTPKITPEFRRYLDAVQTLLSGKPFG